MFSFFQKGFGSSTLQDITAFVAYMYKLGLSHSTINSCMYGLRVYCKLNDFEDNTNRFIVRKLIDGIKRSRSSQIDNRLPISKELLGRISFVLPSICSSNYESALFKAAFPLAYHGLFRISELTVCPQNISNHTVAHNVSSSKTDQFGKGTTIHIPAQTDHKTCPLNLLKSFLQIRPNLKGPSLCHFNGTHLTRYQISALLKRSLSTLGLRSSRLTSHSFRIGRATTFAIEVLSDDEIKRLGRWESNAYLRYTFVFASQFKYICVFQKGGRYLRLLANTLASV